MCVRVCMFVCVSGGDLAPSLGGGGDIFSDQDFLNDGFLRKKIPIFTAEISDDHFLNHRPDFSDFPLIFRIFTMLNVVYDPFLTRKTTISEKNSFMTLFYSGRTFARIRQHYFSKYWGDGCMGRTPTSNFGGPSPQSPLGLPPGLCVRARVCEF